MAMKITGGSVTYEDGRKAAEEYAPARKVSVTLHFAATEDENAEDYMHVAAKLAQAKVHELLGKNTSAAPLATSPPTDKDRLAEAAGLVDAKPAKPAKPVKDKKTEAATPKADDDELLPPATTAAAKDDSIDDMLAGAEEPPKPISDVELNKHCQDKLTKAGDKKDAVVPEIRKLITTYATEEGKKGIAAIPQAKRAEFLTKLEALKV